MTPSHVIDELKMPERMTVFLDDSGTPGKPLESLARDSQFVCAVAFKSHDYGLAHDDLADRLRCLGVPGFHATEIVNPKSHSPWKALSIEKRVRALQFLYSVLNDTPCELLWCPMNSDQFNGKLDGGIQLRREIEDRHSKQLGPKAALWLAMRNAVIKHFADWTDGRLAIVCEDDKGNDDIHIQPAGDDQLALNGIIHAKKSARIHGLELADAAAYLLNRCHHTAARENPNCFDAIITEAWDALQPRFSNVLDDDKK